MEDINYLINWYEETLENINSAKRLLKPDHSLSYMIGTTSESSSNLRPYSTPVREISKGLVLGSVVFSQTQAILLASLVDGIVDNIFVDSEKKLPVVFNADFTPLKHFKLQKYISKDNKVQFGNISAACSNVINKSKLFYYKANDLTVEATWLFLNIKLKDLSGKKIIIFGSGNIGLKLCLKLVECGCEIVLISKDSNKYAPIVNAINSIKNKEVLSSISIADQRIHSFVNADAIIGCTNTSPVITEEMATLIKDEAVVIDVGKGTIGKEAISVCLERNITLWRADISCVIEGMVSSSLNTSEFIQSKYGRKKIAKNLFFVSGGFLGERYDVIVDNYKNPKRIVGLCDTYGKVMLKLDKQAKTTLKLAKKYLENN